MDNKIHELSTKYSRKRLLKRAVSLLCVVVLLFTMNTLKRNANTLERIPTCGLAEHSHSSACYNKAGKLVCGMQEHVHTDACYQEAPKKKKGSKGDLDINLDGYDDSGNLIESGKVQGLDVSLDLDQGGLLDFVQDPGNARSADDNSMEAINGDLQLETSDNKEKGSVANNASSQAQEVTLEFADEKSARNGRSAANMQPVADQPVADQPADDIQDQPVADQPADDAQQPVADQPADDAQQPVADQPADDAQQPVADQPADDAQQPTADQPADDAQQPVADQPTDDAQQPTADQPADDAQQPTADQPTDDAQQPVADQPTDDAQQPAADQPTDDAQLPTDDKQQLPGDDAQQPAEVDQPAADQPTSGDDAQQPTVEAQLPIDGDQQLPGDDQQVTVDVGTQQLITDERQPAAEVEQPAVDQPTSGDDAQQPTDIEQPAVDQPTSGDDAQQPTDIEQPAADQPTSGDDAQQPTDIEQPAVDQPTSGDDAQLPTDDEQSAADQPADDAQQPTDIEQPAVDQPTSGDDAQQPTDDEQSAADQPADDAQQPTDDEQSAADQPADDAQQPTDDEQPAAEQPADDDAQQPTDDEQPVADQPTSDDDAQQPTDDEQPAAEQPADDDAQQPTDDEQPAADQPADDAQQPEDEQPVDEAQQPAERRYTATVDMAGVETYPISLRAVIANAVPAEEANIESNDADAQAPDAEAQAAEEETVLPMGEWSVEFDPDLFEIENTEDDILLTPLADFESTEVELYNGSRYALTLVNCVLEQPQTEAEPEAAIAYPAQHFEGSTDYISVVVDAPVGALPEGTVMVLADVVDQSTIDNIEQSVTEDFVEVKSVHAVDITFLYNNKEIEPKELISVVMRELEAEEPHPQQDTVVVHVDNDGEAQVVASEATAEPGAPAAQPTAQAFEADAFSVYALVKVEKIETKYIDDAGETWSIKLAYTKEARIPEGATLQVAEVKDEGYLTEAEAALESGKRITKARFFDIKIMDREGQEVQPQDKVQVIVTLDGDEGTIDVDPEQTEVGDSEVCAMHFVEQDDAVVKVEKKEAEETDSGVQFDAEGFSVWGVVYTVEFEVEGDQGEITLDFTAFDALNLPEAGEICYNTEDCSIHVALGLLSGIVNSEAEAGYDIDVNADLVNNYEFDFDKAEMGKADSGIRLEGGELVIEADGFVELTEGERLLRVRATGLTALKEAQLETEGVSIEVVEGNVPLGSEVSYEKHAAEKTQELVDYIQSELNKAQPEVDGIQLQPEGDDNAQAQDDVGYAAADLKIVRNDETLPVEGQFKVTVEKESLVPAGMKLDKLYHIHDGAVETLDVTETEAGFEFTMAGFSDIVARYTVEFHNSEKQVVIKGGSQVLLSALIDELGLTRPDETAFNVDDVESVAFSTPDLFRVEEVLNGQEITLNENDDALRATAVIETGHDFVITSLAPFDETEMILTLTDGTRIVVKVTDDQGTGYNIEPKVTIKFYDADAFYDSDLDRITSGTLEAPDPALEDYYYVVGEYTKTDESTSTTQTYWAVKEVPLRTLGETTTATVQFNTFKSVDTEDDAVYYLNSNDFGSFKTRIWRSNVHLDADSLIFESGSSYGTLKDSQGNTLEKQIESGHAYKGGITYSETFTDEIHVQNTQHHQFMIRLRFDPDSTAPIVPDNSHGGDASDDQQNVRYFVMARVTHQSGDVDYGYAYVNIPNPKNLDGVDEDGYYYKDYKFGNWKTKDGYDAGDRFTGLEERIETIIFRTNYSQASFKPERLYTDSGEIVDPEHEFIFGSGDELGSYTVQYDTRDSRHSNKYYTIVDGDKVISYDQITMNSRNIGSEYDYHTILGPNIVYGIVAEHLYQPNHLQTNFAVNHFSGHGHDVRPDLSGDMPGNIVIGEFNISDGSRRNSVGDIADDPTWGRLKVGKPLKGTLMVYADNDSGYFETDENGDKVLASVYDNPNQTIVIPTDGKSLSENIVEPGIEYGKRMSAILASKPASIRPIVSDNRVTIDTRDYDEYATIYLDGDLLKGCIENPGGLTIKKNDHQTIVFNFTDKVNTKELNITQFTVNQPSFANYGYPNGYKTESPEATGSDQNKVMDDIARHIVWNCAACTKKVTIDTAGGIFLQPNDDSETEIKGTTAGWIVSDGYVYNGTAEWHNVFEEMPDSVEVNLFALKYLDGRMPPQNKKYTFQLEKLAFDYDNTDGSVSNQRWEPMETVENNFFTASFTPVRQDQMHLGWNIFRITETGKATGTDGTYITDNTKYYAAVYMDEIVVAEQRVNNIYYTVTMPRYYTAIDETAFQPYNGSDRKPNPELTAVSGPRSAIPVFENETVSTGLTLMKKVNGTTVANKPFVFRIELWKESGVAPDITKQALSTTPTLTGGTWSVEPAEENVTNGKVTYAEVTLKNGRRVTINGLTENTKYRITEIKIGDEVIKDSEKLATLGYIDGYKPVTGADKTGADQYAITGTVEDTQAAYSETFVNEYKSNGHIDLDVSKVMNAESTDGEPVSLIADQFAFTLTSGSTSVTGYNLATTDSSTGKAAVEFPTNQGNVRLSFTQDDMADAKKDEDGHLVKEITYVIHESDGRLTEKQLADYNQGRDPQFSYDNVVYDDDKQITLILTDMGDGTIVVTPKTAADSTVSFTNVEKKKAEKTLEAFKTMEGRDMKKAEFIFNAKLISVNGTNVTEAAMNASGITDEELASLIALRKQASPVDVIGSNEMAEDPTVEGGTTYTTTVSFPTIHYSEPGAYVYEITEDTGSMPVDAKPKDGSVTKYLATVTVSNEMIATVAYSKVVVTGEGDGATETVTALATDEYPTFVNETKTIGFEVTKLWYGQDGEQAGGPKEITFSLTYNNSKKLLNEDLNGHVEKKTGTSGTVEIDGDTVKLTSNASGNWPTAVFSGLPAGRYQIKEESHTAVSGSLMTSYTQPAPTEDDPDAVRISSVVRDGGTQIINNKETKDTYTNITVNKFWKAGETTYVPTSGNLTFELWEMKTAQGGSSSSGFTYRDKVTGDVLTGKTSNNTITIRYLVDADDAEKQAEIIQKKSDYTINEIEFGSGIDGANSVEPRTIVNSSLDIDQTASALEDYKVALDYTITIPESLTANGTVFTPTSANASPNQASQLNIESVSILTKSEDKVRTFILSNANGWSWNSGTLPLSKNDGAITWKYYIKEANVPNHFDVAFSPAGSETGRSGLITTTGSATVTATNTQTDTVERKVKKAWTGNPPEEDTTIQLGLYAGVSEAAALATSPMRTITLDGTAETEPDSDHNQENPAWQANFKDLPKYGTDGNLLVYIVKELEVPEGYRVKYDTDGVATYGVFDEVTGEATVTNEPLGNGSLTITKTESFIGGTAPEDSRSYKLAVKDSKGNYYKPDGTEAADQEAAWVVFKLPGDNETDYTKTWSDLPTGTYTVEEQGVDLDGFVWTVTGLNNVKVDPDEETKHTVTNTFDSETTDIPVIKTWEGGEPGTWSVTFALKSSERLYSVDGVVKSYASPLVGWTSWAAVTEEVESVQQPVTLTITNATLVEERKFADMPKYRVGTGADAGKVYELRYTADETECTTGNGKTYTLAEMSTATRNADGTFSAIDATNAPDNDKTKVKVEKVWEGSGSHPESVTLKLVRYKKGAPKQALVIRHYSDGLNVNGALPAGFQATYTIKCDDTVVEAAATAGTEYALEVGKTYTVTANITDPKAPEGYTYSTQPVSVEMVFDASATPAVTYADVTTTYTDAREYGTLVIAHTTSPSDVTLPGGFTYTINDESATIGSHRVLVGQYTVAVDDISAESVTGYRYDGTNVTGGSGTSATVTVTKDQTTTVSFTSGYTDIRDYGYITIAHVADGLDSNALPSGFAATYTISGDTTVNNAQLGQTYRVLAGSYTVTANVTNSAAPTGKEYVSTPDISVTVTTAETEANPATATLTSTYQEKQNPADATLQINIVLNPENSDETWYQVIPGKVHTSDWTIQNLPWSIESMTANTGNETSITLPVYNESGVPYSWVFDLGQSSFGTMAVSSSNPNVSIAVNDWGGTQVTFSGIEGTLKINISRAITASLATSPFQLAFNPFTAYADEAQNQSTWEQLAAADYGIDSSFSQEIIVNNDNNWSALIEGLDVYDEYGQPYYYSIIEDEVPEGWTASYNGYWNAEEMRDSDVTVTLTATNTPDKPDTGSLKITKKVTVDNGPTSTQLADGTYNFTITGPNSYRENRSITISNGVATSIELYELEVGPYTITETGTTDGHATLSERSVTGTGSQSGTNAIEITVTKDSTAENTIAVFTNNVITGEKTEHNLVTVNKTDGTNALSGATFVLYSDASCTNVVKTFALGSHTSFTINTNDDDLASHLPTGTAPVTLYLKETVAPANHRLDSTVYPVTLTRSVSGATWDATAGKYITTTTYGITVNNKSSETVPNTPLGSIEVTKLVKVDNMDSTELLNKTIKIGLFKGNEPANDATPIQTATLTVTGASTTATLFTDLEMGNYYVYELDGSNHPVKNGGMVTLSGTVYTVTEANPNVTLASAGQVGAVTITNSRTTKVTHDSITVTKVDPDKKPVADATFTLYAQDKETVVKTFTTTEAENGNVFTVATNDTKLAGYLPAEDGDTTTLYLKETVVPDNYKGDANEYPVVITKTVTVTDSKTTTAYAITIDGEKTKEIINTPLGDLQITKTVVAKGEGVNKSGTFWYAIYKAEDVVNGAPKKGENGKLVYPAKDATGKSLVGSITVTENGTGTVTVSKLPYGDYYVFELTGDPGNGDIDVKLIASGTESVDATIDTTVYHVTGSGTTSAKVGATPGTAILTNTVPETSITAEKTWKPYAGQSERMNPVNTKLTLTLTRYIVNGNTYTPDDEFEDHHVDISADANGDITRTDQSGKISKPQTTEEYYAAWSKTWENLPLYGNSNNTVVKYAYMVDEEFDTDRFIKQTGNSGYLPNGDVTTQEFTNIERSPVALPATGGVGTGVIYGAGAALILLAVLGLILRNKKRGEGAGIR